QAQKGAEEFTVRPIMPLYLPGEPIEVAVTWSSARPIYKTSLSILIEGGTGYGGGGAPLGPSASWTVKLDAPKDKGFHIITAHIDVEGKPYRTYHSAFWIRDEDYLGSGPKLGVNKDYFELDG